MNYKDIMVDLETTGTNPDRHAIIQIAAVKFDLETGDVDNNMFDRCLSIPAWRSWEEDTRQWWAKRPALLQELLGRVEPWRNVIQDFADWAGYEGGLRMWAKPIHFEHPFLSSYFKDAGVYNPFDFRQAVDCRSYLRGRAFPKDFVPESELDFVGDAHNAIFDVLHQIKWVLHNHAIFGGQQVIDGQFEEISNGEAPQPASAE